MVRKRTQAPMSVCGLDRRSIKTFLLLERRMHKSPPQSRRVGLIGLGLMGRGLGLSLLRASHALTVLAHRQRSVVDELVVAGAREAANAAKLAETVDTVLLCLPSTEADDAVLFGSRRGRFPALVAASCNCATVKVS